MGQNTVFRPKKIINPPPLLSFWRPFLGGGSYTCPKWSDDTKNFFLKKTHLFSLTNRFSTLVDSETAFLVNFKTVFHRRFLRIFDLKSLVGGEKKHGSPFENQSCARKKIIFPTFLMNNINDKNHHNNGLYDMVGFGGHQRIRLRRRPPSLTQGGLEGGGGGLLTEIRYIYIYIYRYIYI